MCSTTVLYRRTTRRGTTRSCAIQRCATPGVSHDSPIPKNFQAWHDTKLRYSEECDCRCVPRQSYTEELPGVARHEAALFRGVRLHADGIGLDSDVTSGSSIPSDFKDCRLSANRNERKLWKQINCGLKIYRLPSASATDRVKDLCSSD